MVQKKWKKWKKKEKERKGEGVTFCKSDKTFLFVFLSHTSHPFYILQHKHKVGIQFLKECYGKTQNAPHNGKQNSKSHYTILNVKTFTWIQSNNIRLQLLYSKYYSHGIETYAFAKSHKNPSTTKLLQKHELA